MEISGNILFNDSLDSHLENLNEVLGRLTEAGLKLKPSKCNLLQKEVFWDMWYPHLV